MNQTRTSKNAKRLLVWLLLLTMVFGLLPMAAFADETVVEPVVSEEPVQELEHSSEPTEAPSEPTQEPETIPEPEHPGNAAVTIEGDEELEEAALTNNENEVVLEEKWLKPTSSGSYNGGFMKIFFLDCGRKYFSVDNIKKLIDNASAAGFNYIQLAVGNDGLRFLLNDMSLTVNGTLYTTEQVSNAIKTGNANYYNFPVNELTQPEMDTIIAYATEKKMGVIPCVNTPGHMDAILSAATALTGTDCSYSGSARTIDVTNTTAVEFTQALLQKYIDYFKGQGCQFFNMGADEYANDKFTGGSMGFGNLQSEGKYRYYVQYVNQVAAYIKNAGMTPMAFNDGIYFNSNTSSGDFDTDILICYWSSGWSGYSPMPASWLKDKGFSLVNTNGSYYWVLGKSDAQCSPTKADGFNKTDFPGGTISDPSGAMFCIWCDYPGAETEDSVISKTAATIAAFGKTLPNPPTTGGGSTGGDAGTVVELKVGETSRGRDTTAAEGAANTNDANIATASVTKGTATEKTLKEITSASELSAGKQYLIVNNRQNAMLTATPSNWEGNNCLALNGAPTVDSTNLWKIAKSGSYYTIQDIVSNNYLNIGDNTASVGSSAKLTLSYNSEISGWNISYHNYLYNTYYLNDLGESANAGGWEYTYYNNAANDAGSKWRIYEIAETTAASSSNVLTFTGTGEGTTTANIGGVEYTIKVTARETTETKTLNFGESFALPEGVEEVTIEGSAVTRNGSSIVAGNTVSTATVTAVVKNAGGKVTDRYTYTVSVTDEAPAGSMTNDTITLEHWITNAKVGSTSGATDNTQTIANTYEEITSADGVEISTFARNPGYWNDIPVKYWQAMRLDSAHKQTGDNGVDMTSEGTALTHIRYSNAWQYKTADGAWHYFQSDDQLVAYYLQKTEVTKEITTFTKDWGYGTSGTTDYNYEGQVALSVAVVYPDGQLSPTESEIYSKSTTIFNFWTNRDIGIVAPVNNSDYNISKITVTDGARASNTTANQWYANDTITWEKETTASGGRWYKETEVWKKSDGTTPMVNGAASGIKWSAKNTAKLILIYLEPVEKDTNLEIVYYDDTAKREIKSYQVSMTYNQGETVPTFDTALMQGDDTVIGGTKDWPGKTALDTGYLPDDAYVTNSAHIKETFNKNLTELTDIADNYKSGIYEYNGANISEDGKTLTLHYQVKAFENSKTIVVDFGLPVEVTGLLKWFNVTDNGTVKDISLATGTALYDSVGSYGRAVINQNTWDSLTYTLQKLIDAEITIPLYLNFNSGTGQQQRQLKVIPATSVYYEDSFVGKGFKNGTGAANDAMWKLAGTEETAKQALSELGSKNIYGNDKAYENSSKFSMGSAKTVTVNSGMLNGWNDTSAWPTATFTFKGTGFDIISLTNNQSGAIIVTVSKNGNAVKNLLVDNYYGYTKNENGEWVVNNKVENCLYQIPVIQVRDLDYGEYTAEVKVFYNDAFNQTAGSSYSFWFDGFRVYDPMGKDNSIYTQDEEGYPQYIKLRDVVIKNGGERVFFIDGAGEANVTEYKNYGPNNEVYLANGQAISFRLADNANIATIQIGAKSPNAKETTVAKMQLGSSTTDIATATEMYYDITSAAKGQLVTITNNGNAILSLTNIKITYSNQSTTELAALSEGDEQAAVAAVRALYAAPVQPEPTEPTEPDVPQSFEPERFETSWSSNVRKGSRAVLTVKASTDVDAIVVNGVTVTQFKTRTERIGYGWNAKRVTYREFSYMMTASEVGTINIPVVAVSNDLGSSAAYDSTLTVKPSSPIRDWIGGIFGRWF